MTPLERACRALCELDGHLPGATMDGKPLWQDYLPEVRAVITAIREPTPEMVVAGDEVVRNSIRFDKQGLGWRAMIDEMLGDKL